MPRFSSQLAVCGLYACTALMLPTHASAADPLPALGLATGLMSAPVQGNLPPRGELPVPARVQVWVDLTMPAAAAAVMPSSRAAYLHALNAQQELLADSLRAHGAVELARLRLVRNSIAVDLPAEAVDVVRQLPGVLWVRPVTHLHHIDPPPSGAVVRQRE